MGGCMHRDCKEENFGYVGKGKFLIPPDRVPNAAVRFPLRDKWGLSVLLSVMLCSSLGEPVIQGENQTIIRLQ